METTEPKKTKPFSELSQEERNEAEKYWSNPESQPAINAFLNRTRQSAAGLTSEQRYNFGLMAQGLKEG